jgi:predicted nucleic acid-binding protein
MRQRIYTDTSVIGGCFDEEFGTISEELINEFIKGKIIISISDLTLKEIENSPKKVQDVLKRIPESNKEYLVLDDEARFLAKKYIEEGAISQKYLVDSQHIAIATVNRNDVLVSWNFKHIVNLRRIHFYNATNLKYGYPLLEIRSPREVINEK